MKESELNNIALKLGIFIGVCGGLITAGLIEYIKYKAKQYE